MGELQGLHLKLGDRLETVIKKRVLIIKIDDTSITYAFYIVRGRGGGHSIFTNRKGGWAVNFYV